MSVVGDVVGMVTGKGGKDAAKATRAAADTSAAAQMEQLEYLKEINKLPQELRESALVQLGGAYGLEGYDSVDMLAGASKDPLYQAQLSGIGGLTDSAMANIANMTQGAIDASMATASATGGLRGGNLQQGFADISTQEQLARNDVLAQDQMARSDALAQYQNQQLAGLSGLAGLSTGQDQIAQTIGNIGQTQAAGISGAAQAQQAASQNTMNTMMGLGSMGLSAAALFSDPKLKTNIKKIGEKNGFNVYSWTWNKKANEIGLHGDSEGYMANEVELVMPDMVSVDNDTGYKQINYGALNNG